MLPLVNGPRVKLRISSSEKEWDVSVTLLGESSSYFAKMFQGDRFIEGKEREATLEEMDGVVSTRSLQHLLEWVYMDRLSFTSEMPPDLLSEALEFLRIADMCDVHGMEKSTADFVSDLLTKPSSEPVILPQHIKSISLLPKRHPIRPIIAKKLANSFFHAQDFPYFDELSDCPSIGAEILKEARLVFRERFRYY